jgi:hypothetical protein
MSKSQIYKLAEDNGHGSSYLLRKNWQRMPGWINLMNQYLDSIFCMISLLRVFW